MVGTEGLRFSVILKEIPVVLVQADGKEGTYKLKELTGKQRAEYQDSFDMVMELVGEEVKATPAKGFKLPSAVDFLSLCLYDPSGFLVHREFLENLPSSVVVILHKTALQLSGMDKDAIDKAKKSLEGSDTTGIK